MSDSIESLHWECYRIPGISSRGEWRRLMERHLNEEQSPYSCATKGQTLRVWPAHSQAKTIQGSPHTYRDAYEVRRVDFGASGNGTLIGLSIARLYFEQGAESPSNLRQSDLFQPGQYPPVLRHVPMLKGISDFVAYLAQAPELSTIAQHKEYTAVDLSTQVMYHTSAAPRSLQSLTQGVSFYKNLLELVRHNPAFQKSSVRLGVLPNLVEDHQKVHEIADQIVAALKKWGCDASWIKIEHPDSINNFVANRSREDVVLVPLDGQRGVAPPPHVRDLLKNLDLENIPFQLCSTATNPVYSRHGLAISILQRAGGIHFTTRPLNNELFQGSWYIGLDLGYGGVREGGRIAKITLTDSTGAMKAYWRTLKDKTESLPLPVLAAGLRWIVEQAEKLEPDRHLVVIRDGICPRDERIEDYKEAMGQRPFTLIEYAKSGSPLMHINQTQPNPGTLLIPASSDFTALYSCLASQPKVLTHPIKFRVRLNPQNLAERDVGEILLALCHSSNLSYQPSRVPAPIKWANGLAKLAWADLQYAGWSHLPHRTVDMRE